MYTSETDPLANARTRALGVRRRSPRTDAAAVARWLLCAAMLGGCALGPDFHRPDPPSGPSVLRAAPPAAMPADGRTQRFDRRTDVAPDWWKQFHCAALDALVREGLANSPSLGTARATLQEAQDNLRAGYGVFFPQIGASLGATRESSVFFLGPNPIRPGPFNLATLQAAVTYTPDLFGAERRTVESLGAQVDAQRYALIAARVTPAGNIVNTAIARAGYAAQRDAQRRIIAEQREQIDIARVQVRAGTAPYSSVVAIQSQLAASRATLAALDQRLDQTGHLLAQLVGKAPGAFSAPPIALRDLALPEALPDSLPSRVARHRPDILIAEAQLHAASAGIGIATANLFPDLTLGGAVGRDTTAIASILHNGYRFWSLQASLAGSLFSGGTQWYQRKAAIDAYDAALATYDQTVLAGLSQVADTMRALDHDAQALRAQADARVSASETLHLVQANFTAGTASYLELLTADALVRQADLGYLGAVAQRLQDTVAFYAALGGGWWNPAPPASAPRKSPVR